MDRSLAAEVARLRREVAEIRRGQRVAHGAALENASITVRDGDGSLRAIVGQQADGTSGVNVVNGPTPPTPTDPTVTPALGALTVAWDGTFTDAPNAPLDWMRCEVHVGPDASFTPDQGTLRDTIETAQGGSVVVPLPYTEWWVKLRSRSAAGVAGAASLGVAGTPRKAEAADITAGAITADAIAVDALTGKTITGGTITGTNVNGATVTGGVVQTGTSGRRVVLTPNGDGGLDGTVPATRYYTGDAAEGAPAQVYATLRDMYGAVAPPTLALRSPVTTDPDDYRSFLDLQTNTPGTERDSTFTLAAASPDGMGGAAAIEGNASDGTGAIVSHVALSAYDPATGAYGQLTITPNGFDMSPDMGWATLENGVFTTSNTARGRVTITPAGDGIVTSMNITGLYLYGTDFYGQATARTTVPGDRKPAGASGVTGVGVAGETSSGMTVYVNRQNTIATIVNWHIEGI